MILLYTPDKEKQTAITGIFSGMKKPVKTIGPADLKKTIAELIESPVKAPAKRNSPIPPLYPMPELLIMSGVTSEELDRFLAEYKRTGLAPIARKAMVTPSNLFWSLYDLAEELGKEDRRLK